MFLKFLFTIASSKEAEIIHGEEIKMIVKTFIETIISPIPLISSSLIASKNIKSLSEIFYQCFKKKETDNIR